MTPAVSEIKMSNELEAFLKSEAKNNGHSLAVEIEQRLRGQFNLIIPQKAQQSDFKAVLVKELSEKLSSDDDLINAEQQIERLRDG